jgi:hypothetical protein
MMYKYLGLAMVLLSWAAGAYLLCKWRGTRAMSISQHAASATGAAKVFAGTLIIAGLGFYIWLVTWFSAELQLSALFTVVISLIFVCQVIAAVVSDTKDWKKTVHRVAAYLMAVLYIPLAFLILAAQDYSLATRIVCIAAIAYMVLAWCLFLFVRQSRNHYLLIQSAYIILFQCAILFAAYVR